MAVKEELQTLEDLITQVRQYRPSADLDPLRRAFEFADRAHRGQFRDSGVPFLQHPLSVAIILAEIEMDLETIMAALLHDVVEDTAVDLDILGEEFDDEIALLVDGVTKLSQLESKTRVERQAENLRKMFLAMAEDIRVILIKLADRLHNMRTLAFRRIEKQKVTAQETLDIFAPLAHRLGISRIQWELEDLALRHLEPEKYRELVDMIPQKREEREEYTKSFIDRLHQELEDTDIEVEIHGRAKHVYSIYRKLKGPPERDLSEVYDLVAIRVIVDTIKDCYAVLGVVHSLWKPIPGRFKDFIAVPKSNMYQSLHTSVIGPFGEPFEIQIRTWEMHRTAEYGIAAHWRYKEGSTDEDFDEKLSWLRRILEWQNELRDAREFMESLKIDIFADEVFVFTPQGDVIDLPSGACPVDFAYRIHTEVGHECVGAKVNGKIVSLDQELENGDIVEILTNKSSKGPSADWLNIVKTSSAKNRIRQWFKRQKRDENLERGKELIEKEIKKQGLRVEELWNESWLNEAKNRFGFQSLEDLYVAIGYGGQSASQVVARLKERYEQQQREETPITVDDLTSDESKRRGADGSGVSVKGIDNVLVRFSRCCNPVPGDPILGYITRGRGVSIHHADCPNINKYIDDEERIIEVTWENVDANYYPVEIQVNALDRPGLLSDVAQTAAETRVNILSAEARTYRDRTAVIDMVLEIRNLEELGFIRQKLEALRDVKSVKRVSRRKAR